MRAPVAWAAVRRRAEVQASARHRNLCSTLSFERPRQEKRHGNGARLAGIWSICDTAAASLMAQQWVVEKESVVRSRAYPASARPGGASALLRALMRGFQPSPPPASGRGGWGAGIARMTALCVLVLTAACAPRLAREGPDKPMP